MNHPADPHQRSAEDLLPPVQPPAATFIMQLFFIPLLIVSLIVGVWMLFSWIANMGTQPAELVDKIEYLNHASWQKALTLANTLRDPRYEYLRSDPALADRVCTLLDKQLDAHLIDRDHVWLQIYLCRVLGEFNIDPGLPTLVKAASQEEPAENIEVRRSALQAMSLLIERIGPSKALENEQLVPTLISIGQMPDAPPISGEGDESSALTHRLRSTAAYVLGLLDTPASRGQLVNMLGDSSDDVRYNAAIGLARLGDTRAEPVLIEMLQPSNDALLAGLDQTILQSEQQQWLIWRRNLIVSNALKAAQRLMASGDPAECRQLRASIAEVAHDPRASDQIKAAAKSVADANPSPIQHATGS